MPRIQKIMTKEIQNKIPALYTQDGATDPTVFLRCFSPYSHHTWLFTEFDGKDQLFGWAKCPDGSWECGYSSLSELQNTKTRFGTQAVERDAYFQPKPLSEAKK